MGRDAPKPDVAKSLRMIEAAIAAGTHSPACNAWCTQCGGPMPHGAYHVVEGTRRRLCRDCAPESERKKEFVRHG